MSSLRDKSSIPLKFHNQVNIPLIDPRGIHNKRDKKLNFQTAKDNLPFPKDSSTLACASNNSLCWWTQLSAGCCRLDPVLPSLVAWGSCNNKLGIWNKRQSRTLVIVLLVTLHCWCVVSANVLKIHPFRQISDMFISPRFINNHATWNIKTRHPYITFYHLRMRPLLLWLYTRCTHGYV